MNNSHYAMLINGDVFTKETEVKYGDDNIDIWEKIPSWDTGKVWHSEMWPMRKPIKKD